MTPLPKDYLSIFDSDPDLTPQEKQAIRDAMTAKTGKLSGKAASPESPQPGFPYQFSEEFDPISDEEED